MRKYDKEFKEEAVNLSDEIAVRKASEQLGIPYYSLAEWHQKRKAYGEGHMSEAEYIALSHFPSASVSFCGNAKN